MIDMSFLMLELSRRFPLFHSEDDFKFQLAWLVKELNQSLNVNLERKLLPDVNDRTDLVISDSNQKIPIELKYKTTKTDVRINGERFVLKEQGARDYTRYDFLRDVVRIETLVDRIDNVDEGYSIMITMDHSFKHLASEGTLSSLFPVHQDSIIHGQYSFDDKDSEKYSTRAKPLVIKGHYKMSWNQYSMLNINNQAVSLYYLIVRVTKDVLKE